MNEALIEQFKEIAKRINKGELKGDHLNVALGSLVLASKNASHEEIDEVIEYTNKSVTNLNPIAGLIASLLAKELNEDD